MMRIYLAVVFLAVAADANVHRYIKSEERGRAKQEMTNKFILNRERSLEYMLVYLAQPWERARTKCKQAGMKLAVPQTQQEFYFLQNIVRGMKYRKISSSNHYKLLVWLGINNLENYAVWRTVDGESLKETEFSKSLHAEGYSDSPSEPRCVGMDATNPFLRTYWCNRYQPYICQKKFSSDEDLGVLNIISQ